MKSLIVVYSYHHGNTAKVADTMAKVLGCEMKQPEEIDYESVSDYDIVGFGAGIDSAKHYAPMLDFVRGLKTVQGKKAFIFSTSGIISKNSIKNNHAALREILSAKGYQIVDEFACKGYNTNSVLKYIGGMNKGRPNVEDFQNATDFVRKLAVGD